MIFKSIKVDQLPCPLLNAKVKQGEELFIEPNGNLSPRKRSTLVSSASRTAIGHELRRLAKLIVKDYVLALQMLESVDLIIRKPRPNGKVLLQRPEPEHPVVATFLATDRLREI
jgi:hypothetical protein